MLPLQYPVFTCFSKGSAHPQSHIAASCFASIDASTSSIDCFGTRWLVVSINGVEHKQKVSTVICRLNQIGKQISNYSSNDIEELLLFRHYVIQVVGSLQKHLERIEKKISKLSLLMRVWIYVSNFFCQFFLPNEQEVLKSRISLCCSFNKERWQQISIKYSNLLSPDSKSGGKKCRQKQVISHFSKKFFDRYSQAMQSKTHTSLTQADSLFGQDSKHNRGSSFFNKEGYPNYPTLNSENTDLFSSVQEANHLGSPGQTASSQLTQATSSCASPPSKDEELVTPLGSPVDSFKEKKNDTKQAKGR